MEKFNFFIPPKIGQSDGAYQWRVCYQRAAPVSILVGRHFKIFNNLRNCWLVHSFKKIINWSIYLLARLQMHDLKRIFHIFQ